jgi:hypothetical protein
MAMSDHLYLSAVDYYVAGRFAARASLVPLAGNMMHHAIELSLKAALVERVGMDKLRHKFGHNVPKLWNEYRGARTNLSKFDRMVAEVDRFEEIRYPDALAANGGNTLTSWIAHRDDLRGHPALQAAPIYELVVHDVDEFIVTLLDSEIGYDVWPHSRLFVPTALDAIMHNNPFADRWAPMRDPLEA